MTLEQFIEKLKEASPSGLLSVVLYGSAAAGDHIPRKSDYNILIILADLKLERLKALAPVAVAWEHAGQPAPLLFTPEQLKKSADVFPIELLDIQEGHKILYGEDLVSRIEVHRQHLRHQVEHELKAQLIQLRREYLLTKGHSSAVIRLMEKSMSTFLVLFRAALRLYQSTVPVQKMEALKALTAYIPLQVDFFQTIHQVKAGELPRRGLPADELFSGYLSHIELVINAVDTLDSSGG
jgi:predicted nucleotidyltransferase